MIINRCPKCEGRKNIVSLGNMIKKCPECHGVGHVKIEEKVVEDDSTAVETLVIEKFRSPVELPAVKIDKRKKQHKESHRA